MLAPARLVLPPLHPARRAPVLPAHRRRPQARRQRVLPGRVPAHRRLRRRRRRLGQPGRAHRDPRHRLRRQGRVLQGAARTAPLTDRILRCPWRARPGGAHDHRCPATGRRAACTPHGRQRLVALHPRSTKCHDHLNHHQPPHNGDPGSVPCIRQLWFQVVIGAVLGIAVGILLPDVGKAVEPAQRLVHRPGQDDRRPGRVLRRHPRHRLHGQPAQSRPHRRQGAGLLPRPLTGVDAHRADRRATSSNPAPA